MTVKQLKALLENAPDNLVVVMDAFDHNYQPITHGGVVEAHDQEDGSYGEYGGPECEADYGKKTQVFHLGG